MNAKLFLSVIVGCVIMSSSVNAKDETLLEKALINIRTTMTINDMKEFKKTYNLVDRSVRGMNESCNSY